MENKLKERLKGGERLEFGSDNNMMFLSYHAPFGSNKYWTIELNANTIKMTQTFPPFEQKVDWLVESRNLIFIDEPDPEADHDHHDFDTNWKPSEDEIWNNEKV